MVFPSNSVRVADPDPGTTLGFPDMQALIARINAEAPGLLVTQSCPVGLKYINNPWQDRMIDRLREYDTRFGYNGKPTRTAADNGGVPVVAAGDEITYFAGAGIGSGLTHGLRGRHPLQPLRPDARADVPQLHRRGRSVLERRRTVQRVGGSERPRTARRSSMLGAPRCRAEQAHRSPLLAGQRGRTASPCSRAKRASPAGEAGPAPSGRLMRAVTPTRRNLASDLSSVMPGGL